MKLGTFVDHVLQPTSADKDHEDDSQSEDEQAPHDETVAQIILNDANQQTGNSLLHKKKIHSCLLSNYIAPIPSLNPEPLCIWKPFVLYVDQDQCQYLLVQVIQKQGTHYNVIANKLINAFQVSG